MERLTKRDTDGQAMMDCEKCKADWTGKHGKPMVDCTALYCRNRLKDRIAAYEDRGCAPEEVLPKDKADEIALKLMRLADLESLCNYTRLRELAEADKDGRLVVLPCKEPVMRVIRLFDKLQKVPAADVAPVVRCMDCKHLVSANVNGKEIPTCRVSGMEVAPDEFCSRGKKGRR